MFKRTLMIFLMTLLTSMPLSYTLAKQSGDISKQQAVAIAQQQHPGRVLSVNRQGDSYRVKTIDQAGKVRIILIDAASGRILSGQ